MFVTATCHLKSASKRSLEKLQEIMKKEHGENECILVKRIPEKL